MSFWRQTWCWTDKRKAKDKTLCPFAVNPPTLFLFSTATKPAPFAETLWGLIWVKIDKLNIEYKLKKLGVGGCGPVLYQTVPFVCIPQLPHSLFLQHRNNNGRKTGYVLERKKKSIFPKSYQQCQCQSTRLSKVCPF